ncbi:MAG: hypothetical protein KGY54_03080 [Oleiphilaceae bacterium]|nr:hypothetical protein [Oleiphilaceae bacterium]
MKTYFFPICVTVLIVGAAPTVAASLALPVPPLDDQALESRRGGFQVGDLEIAIGLEQVVSINGEDMVVNRLTIPNLNGPLNGGVITHQIENMIHRGGVGQEAGTIVSGSAGDGSSFSSFVQNRLDSAVIQNLRQLDIEVNNLGPGQRLPFNLDDQMLQYLGR